MEQELLNDQCSKRKMALGNVDVATINALRKKEARKSRELQKIVKFNQKQDNDSAEEQQSSLPIEPNQPGSLNIQEMINLPGLSK